MQGSELRDETVDPADCSDADLLTMAMAAVEQGTREVFLNEECKVFRAGPGRAFVQVWVELTPKNC